MEATHNDDAPACNCTPPCVYDAGEINDDHCEHGELIDDDHPCGECLTDRADWLLDAMREALR
jgi:hypothetical protein